MWPWTASSRGGRPWLAAACWSLLVVGTLVAAGPPAATERLTDVSASSRPAPSAPLAATLRDLGTLGGLKSEAVAVSGSVVVGWAQTGTGLRHAFAADVSIPGAPMVDLDPGSARMSEAVAVDDGVVVGTVLVAEELTHAFAYDVRAAQPRLLDLGSLGSGSSWASGVSNGLVVGAYEPVGPRRGETTVTRAFAYDLRAPDPRMVDLGTLPDEVSSGAEGVSGRLVAGWSGPGLNVANKRAVVFDLSGPLPVLREVFPGQAEDVSRAMYVAGTTVVGDLERMDGTWTGGWYLDTARGGSPILLSGALAGGPDATDGSSVLMYNGSHGPRVVDVTGDVPRLARQLTKEIEAKDVDGRYVVGADWSMYQFGLPFAQDLGAGRGGDLDLGLPPGGRGGGDVVAVDGSVAAGWVQRPVGRHAAAWLLHPPTGAWLHLDRRTLTVVEGRDAVITVHRLGPVNGRATVHYRTRRYSSSSARPSLDFEAVRGVVRFAPGQRVARIVVPVAGDDEVEGREMFGVLLLQPRGAEWTGRSLVMVSIPGQAHR